MNRIQHGATPTRAKPILILGGTALLGTFVGVQVLVLPQLD